VYTLTVKRPKEVGDSTGPGIAVKIGGEPQFGDTYYFGDGETVSFTATPNFGYKITSLTILKTADNTVFKTITPNPRHLYSFVMGDDPVTITGTSEATPAVFGVKYVHSGGAGTGDGTSWANASGNLQKMIDEYQSGQEIWIAGGTFTPDWSEHISGKSLWTSTNDRKQWAFVLRDGVRIYGGFTGTEAGMDDKADRDWRAHMTVLSGDLAEFSGDPADGNAIHVVIAAGLGTPPLLEGLTISGGKAVTGTDMTVNSGNIVYTRGGGLYCVDASPILCNVIIEDNQALSGGGIYADGTDENPILINVSIIGNSTTGKGGGIFVNKCMLLIINGYISGNGGSNVIAPNASGGAVTLVNTTISGNQTTGLNMSYAVSGNPSPVHNYIFNSVIRDNPTPASTVSVSNGALHFYNSIVPGHADTLPVNENYADQGLNGCYPLAYPFGNTPALYHNTNSDTYVTDYNTNVYTVLNTELNKLSAALKQEVLGYLAKDRNGNKRINGAIDLGAEEQQ
jgi:predicted outer membrane repeat protein